MQYERDAEGNVTNPPVDPDFERRLQTAHQQADQRQIQRIMDEYTKWRDQRVKDDESYDDTPMPERNLDAEPGTGSGVSQQTSQQDLPGDRDKPADKPASSRSSSRSSRSGKGNGGKA